MEIKDFYTLSKKYFLTTFAASLVESTKTGEEFFELKRKLLFGEYEGLCLPAVFDQRECEIPGKIMRDILETRAVGFYLISRTFKELLESHNFTGWKTHPIKIYDKKGNDVPGYFGFSVTGRCGSCDYTK